MPDSLFWPTVVTISGAILFLTPLWGKSGSRAPASPTPQKGGSEPFTWEPGRKPSTEMAWYVKTLQDSTDGKATSAFIVRCAIDRLSPWEAMQKFLKQRVDSAEGKQSDSDPPAESVPAKPRARSGGK